MSIPRPEYPRPQFVRPEWLNLNGEWEFAFDDEERGIADGWSDGRRLPQRIVVPFPYQCELSGINDQSIHEVVWYARSFDCPSDWKRDVLIHFGAVDYHAILWVNGREVGHNRGGHVPFSFDISPYLHPGENRITLRVEDRQDPKQPRGKQASIGVPHGIDYYCTTGIWQTVWLEPVDPIRIEDLRVCPLTHDSALDMQIYLHAPATGWHVEVQAFDGDREVACARVRAHEAVAHVRLEIPDAKRWSPDSPHLYGLKVRMLNGGAVHDEVESYAGLRSVRLQDGRMLLNGEPIYLISVLDQGYWPQSYLAAPSDDALREDVEWIKRFGFNAARKHQKVEDPRWYYWCDRLGLLVWAEMPNGRAWSVDAEEALMAEWERAVDRDFNHPCVITWVPVNESMGFPDLRNDHPGQYSFLERIVSTTRHRDFTRPVVDNDGWEHTDITDIIAIHDYSHTKEQLAERYADACAGGQMPARTWTGSRAIWALGSRYRGQPVMLTEVGGFLLLPPGVPQEDLDRLYKIYDSFRTPDELLAKYEQLMEGIGDLNFVAGFCYTQLTDIEQEINGLLTYDRRPKISPERIAEIHRRCFAGQVEKIRQLPPA